MKRFIVSFFLTLIIAYSSSTYANWLHIDSLKVSVFQASLLPSPDVRIRIRQKTLGNLLGYPNTTIREYSWAVGVGVEMHKNKHLFSTSLSYRSINYLKNDYSFRGSVWEISGYYLRGVYLNKKQIKLSESYSRIVWQTGTFTMDISVFASIFKTISGKASYYKYNRQTYNYDFIKEPDDNNLIYDRNGFNYSFGAMLSLQLKKVFATPKITFGYEQEVSPSSVLYSYIDNDWHMNLFNYNYLCLKVNLYLH